MVTMATSGFKRFDHDYINQNRWNMANSGQRQCKSWWNMANSAASLGQSGRCMDPGLIGKIMPNTMQDKYNVLTGASILV